MKSWRRIRPSPRRSRKGTILLLAAILLISLIGICALTVDLGYLCVARAELQRSADAAALAAVSVMQDQHDPNGTSPPSYIAYKARNAACQYASLNPCRSGVIALSRNDANDPAGDLVLGHYNSTTLVFEPASTRYNSAYVRARRDFVQNGPLDLFFGSLFGQRQIGIDVEAAAYIEDQDVNGFYIGGSGSSTCKLLPFTLQIDLWQARLGQRIDDWTHHGSTSTVSRGPDGIFEINIYPGKVAPGNFGTIDLGSENNTTTDLSRQIRYGPNAYDLSFFPNHTIQLNADGVLTLNGETGISAAIKDDLAAIIGQPRILPLHATMRGNGDTAYFDIVAFVGITVLDVKLTGAMNSKYLKIQPGYAADDTAIAGGPDVKTSEHIRTPPRLRKVR